MSSLPRAKLNRNGKLSKLSSLQGSRVPEEAVCPVFILAFFSKTRHMQERAWVFSTTSSFWSRPEEAELAALTVEDCCSLVQVRTGKECLKPQRGVWAVGFLHRLLRTPSNSFSARLAGQSSASLGQLPVCRCRYRTKVLEDVYGGARNASCHEQGPPWTLHRHLRLRGKSHETEPAPLCKTKITPGFKQVLRASQTPSRLLPCKSYIENLWHWESCSANGINGNFLFCRPWGRCFRNLPSCQQEQVPLPWEDCHRGGGCGSIFGVSM